MSVRCQVPPTALHRWWSRLIAKDDLRSQWEGWYPWLIVAAGLLAYMNSFGGPFIFDDLRHIVDNPRIRHWWPVWHLVVGTTRPLVNLSFAVNYAFGGPHVWGYHAVNIAIHLAAGLTLYGLLRRTLLTERLRAAYGPGAAALAAATALLWMVHPLQTQSVTYIVQRGESLMGLCYLLVLYALCRSTTARQPTRWGLVSLLACAAGMSTKPIMVTAPLLALCYDRVFLAGSWRAAWHQRKAWYLGYAATWILLAVLLIAGRNDYAATAGFGFKKVTAFEYVCSQPGIILHYLQLGLWPHPLVLDYGWLPPTTWAAILVPAFVIAGLLVAVLWLWRRAPALGFPGVWFFLILAPSSSVLPIKDLAFEHRMYLSLAGLIVLVQLGVVAMLRRAMASPTARRGLATTLVAAVALTFGALTYRRNQDYQSVERIWRDVIAKRPGNYRAYNNLGVALAVSGRQRESLEFYRKAMQLEPQSAEAYNNLGLALAELGQYAEAITYCRHALELAPDYPEAHNNLGLALFHEGHLEEAIAQYRQALALRPMFDKAYNNLGLVFAAQGKFAESEAAYRRALEIQPTYAEVYSNMSVMFAKQNRFGAATACLEQAIRLKPDYARAYNNLANVLAQQGRFGEAMAQYQTAMRLDPQYPEPRLNMQRLIEHQRQQDDRLAPAISPRR